MTALFPPRSLAALHDLVAASAACLRVLASAGLSEQLQAELETLFASQNTSGSDDQTVLPATFLRVSVTC